MRTWIGHYFYYWPTVHVHWTENNLSCLNKTNCLVKLKNFSCVFMSSACTNTWSWGSLCQSFCLFYSFFQCQILEILHLVPLCTQNVYHLSKNYSVPIVANKVTMSLFLCSIKIRSLLKHAKSKMLCPRIAILTPPPAWLSSFRKY